MRKLPVFVLIATLTASALGADDRPARELKDQKLQLRINKAIANGIGYLRKTQKKSGSWKYDVRGRTNDATGGLTALAMYALAASGVKERDKTIRAALAWTENNRKPFGNQAMYGTYSASLLVLALTRINQHAYRTTIHRHAESLVKSQLDSDMWTYRVAGYAGEKTLKKSIGRMRFRLGDNSNSQFAILALWAAYSLTDYRVPTKTWQRIRNFYKGTQLPSGGWSYVAPDRARRMPRGGMVGRPSMTAAGLVAYVYSMAALDGSEKALQGARASRVAQKGLAALMGTRHDYQNFYFAYAMERVGTVMDLPLPGWYVPGAKMLVIDQRRDGSWRESRFSHGDSEHVYATSLALLFLSRNTLPPRRAAVTKRERFPDLSDPAQLTRGFDFYLAYKPQQRIKVLHEFGKAGPAAVGLLVGRLSDERAEVRVTAFELLGKLLDKRFFFEPRGSADERAVMLAPIEAYWKRHGPALRWDEGQAKFVVRK